MLEVSLGILAMMLFVAAISAAASEPAVWIILAAIGAILLLLRLRRSERLEWLVVLAVFDDAGALASENEVGRFPTHESAVKGMKEAFQKFKAAYPGARVAGQVHRLAPDGSRRPVTFTMIEVGK